MRFSLTLVRAGTNASRMQCAHAHARQRARTERVPAHAHATQRARKERVPARNQCTHNESVRCTHALLARTQPAADGHEPWSSTSRLVAGLLPSAFDMQVQGCSGRKPGRTKCIQRCDRGHPFHVVDAPMLLMRPWPPFTCAPVATLFTKAKQNKVHTEMRPWPTK